MVAVLCCGEALIDMVPHALPQGLLLEPRPGGAALNTAVALGRLGVPTGLLSGLGTDFLADRLRGALTDAGVDLSLCVTTPRPCTLAFVDLSHGAPRYAFYDAGTADRMLTAADLPARVDADCLLLGGISLAMEPCGDAFETLMRREAGRSVTMIDANIRPAAIRDAAAYRARLARMLGAADIVKLSNEDLDWLAPGDGAAFTAGLIARGTALVLVTEGAAGATARTRAGAWCEPAPAVPVHDTVGAGDTFNAGVLASLHAAGALVPGAVHGLGESVLRGALRRGIAAAAITVGRAGANPPWAHELA